MLVYNVYKKKLQYGDEVSNAPIHHGRIAHYISHHYPDALQRPVSVGVTSISHEPGFQKQRERGCM
jgi:hypothetical protein